MRRHSRTTAHSEGNRRQNGRGRGGDETQPEGTGRDRAQTQPHPPYTHPPYGLWATAPLSQRMRVVKSNTGTPIAAWMAAA